MRTRGGIEAKKLKLLAASGFAASCRQRRYWIGLRLSGKGEQVALTRQALRGKLLKLRQK